MVLVGLHQTNQIRSSLAQGKTIQSWITGIIIVLYWQKSDKPHLFLFIIKTHSIRPTGKKSWLSYLFSEQNVQWSLVSHGCDYSPHDLNKNGMNGVIYIKLQKYSLVINIAVFDCNIFSLWFRKLLIKQTAHIHSYLPGLANFSKKEIRTECSTGCHLEGDSIFVTWKMTREKTISTPIIFLPLTVNMHLTGSFADV